MTDDHTDPSDEPQVEDLELSEQDAEGVAGGITAVENVQASFLLPAVKNNNVNLGGGIANAADGSV